MIKKFLLSLLLVISTSLAVAAQSNNLTLAWDASCSPTTVGYTFMYGTGNLFSTNVMQAYVNDCGITVPLQTNMYHSPYSVTNFIAGRTNTSATVNGLTPGSTYYFAVATTDTNGLTSTLSAEVAYSVPVFNPPSITAQPVNLTVNQYSNFTFSVVAAGSAPLSYQWKHAGTNLVGATLATYTKSNAQSTDAGAYSVIITNIAGTVTSATATLAVNTFPTIPQNFKLLSIQ